jgi:hypothetical protein
MAGRPPTKEITTAIQKDAYKPTLGSTPAIIENAMLQELSKTDNKTRKNISTDIREPLFSYIG